MKQVFTFCLGYDHQHHGKYVVIEGKNRNDCRKKMFEKFGKDWAFQYDSKEKAGVYQFNLEEVK